MKRRLFWKILLGFWFTFLVITQGTWLMFTLLRPEPSDYAAQHRQHRRGRRQFRHP